MATTTARLRVQNPEGRGPVFEEVPVEHSGGGTMVLNSPVLVENIAAGDVIAVHPDGSFDVVRRGGNLSVQFFRSEPQNRVAETSLTAAVRALGGRLDAEHRGVLVYTIPLRGVGFPAIEAAFNAANGAEGWMFGNVYDPVDGTPLNWWVER